MRNRVLAALAALVILVAGVAIAEDLHGNTKGFRAISPVTVSNNTAQTGSIVDTRGYNGLEYYITIATVADTDATFTPTVQECALDNCADAATADNSVLQGTVTAATFTIADNNTVKMIGYKGSVRYNRIIITPANNSGAATFSVTAVQGGAKYKPVN